MIYRIKELTPMSCYRLRVVFDDGRIWKENRIAINDLGQYYLSQVVSFLSSTAVCTSFALLLPPRLLIPRILIPHSATASVPGQIFVEAGDLPCWN